MMVYGPELTVKNVEPFLTAPGLTEFDIGGCRVWAADTIHDGDRYRDVPHCSYFLEMDGQTVFIAGDGSDLGELKKRYVIMQVLPTHETVIHSVEEAIRYGNAGKITFSFSSSLKHSIRRSVLERERIR